jgi:hypothetical protein
MKPGDRFESIKAAPKAVKAFVLQSVKYLAGHHRASVIDNCNIQGAETSPRHTRSGKVVKYKDS